MGCGECTSDSGLDLGVVEVIIRVVRLCIVFWRNSVGGAAKGRYLYVDLFQNFCFN